LIILNSIKKSSLEDFFYAFKASRNAAVLNHTNPASFGANFSLKSVSITHHPSHTELLSTCQKNQILFSLRITLIVSTILDGVVFNSGTLSFHSVA